MASDPASPSAAPRSRPGPSPAIRRSSTATSTSSRLRSASSRLINADLPPGFFAATGSAASRAPSVGDIRKGRVDTKDGSINRQPRRPSAIDRIPVAEEQLQQQQQHTDPQSQAQVKPDTGTSEHIALVDIESRQDKAPPPAETAQPNGYQPPPKLPWTTSTAIALRHFWQWFLTPAGFLITLYGLNVVAWGGMLFLLLCNAAPAMCKPDCNDINSPRRIWIETDSQILNALFCVTGFGLIPWRFRDLWFWAKWRLGRSPEKKSDGIRRLAGIHRGWFRLPGSNALDEDKAHQLAATSSPSSDFGLTNDTNDTGNPAIPIPASKIPDDPVTGVRAPPTAGWRMDFVVWCNVWNTFFQTCLCGFMWGLNRIDRPSWSTGLFVALAFGVAGAGGIMMFVEGKRVKKVEGVPPPKVTRKGDGKTGTSDVDVEQQNLGVRNGEKSTIEKK